MTFAGKYKYLTVTGCILSGISAVIALVPYLCMWKVIKLAVLNWPGGLAGGTLVYWGWMAVASSLLSMLIYFGALLYFPAEHHLVQHLSASDSGCQCPGSHCQRS